MSVHCHWRRLEARPPDTVRAGFFVPEGDPVDDPAQLDSATEWPTPNTATFAFAEPQHSCWHPPITRDPARTAAILQQAASWYGTEIVAPGDTQDGATWT